VDAYAKYAWSIVAVALAAFGLALMQGGHSPSWGTFIFWTILLIAAELLPVSLAFESAITMSFPLMLALAALFPPWAAMAIAGLGAFDPREFRRTIPLHRALFNRSQLMLAVGAASAIVSFAIPTTVETGERLADLTPFVLLMIGLGGAVHIALNFALVVFAIHFKERIPVWPAFQRFIPQPAAGFWMSYIVLAGLGVAIAVVYSRIPGWGDWAVAAFVIPLLFARLSIVGARTQQELTQRVQEQQHALLQATESLFKEREEERNRIAAHIHDTGLQYLAAATFACDNARTLLEEGRDIEARDVMGTAGNAVGEAIKVLRESLVDLRASLVEQGGLVETVRTFAQQASTLWNVDVNVMGELEIEPPAPVSLAAVQIIQEGLNNALKHAQADSITVRIGETDGMIRIVVEDKGVGFDPTAHVGDDHLGLGLMKERAHQLGADISLESVPGEGTRLQAIFPGAIRS